MEASTHDEVAPIDWALCKKLAGNKEYLAQEMLEMLIEGLPQDKANIKQAYDAKNYTELREHVHRLHGACCYVGVPKLKAIAKELEDAIAHEVMDKVTHYVTALEKEVAKILSYYAEKEAAVA